MGDPAGLSLYSARQRGGQALDAALVSLAKQASKLSSTQVLRELLATASAPGSDALFVDALRRCLCSPLVRTVDGSEQLELIQLLRQTLGHPPMTEKLLELLSHPRLSSLTRDDRRRLLSYSVGPPVGPHAGPDRAPVLMGAWLTRARAAHDLLNTHPGPEAVREFLCKPSQGLYLLRTTTDLDLLIVSFGAPSSPGSLSYHRTFYEDEKGQIEATVSSPCPYIASGWRVQDGVAEQTMQCRGTHLTRLEELDLVRWIEHNHLIGALARAPMQASFGYFVNARRFSEAVEPIANLIASSRGPLNYRCEAILRGRSRRRAAARSIRGQKTPRSPAVHGVRSPSF